VQVNTKEIPVNTADLHLDLAMDRRTKLHELRLQCGTPHHTLSPWAEKQHQLKASMVGSRDWDLVIEYQY
jgi:hypothetical protein